jgi:hypothetical protein
MLARQRPPALEWVRTLCPVYEWVGLRGLFLLSEVRIWISHRAFGLGNENDRALAQCLCIHFA